LVILLRVERELSLLKRGRPTPRESQLVGSASSSPSLPTLELAVSSEAMVRGAGPPAPSSQASEGTPRAAQPSLHALCMRTAARWPEQDGADYLPCSHAPKRPPWSPDDSCCCCHQKTLFHPSERFLLDPATVGLIGTSHHRQAISLALFSFKPYGKIY
jgi:hypothetical protein